MKSDKLLSRCNWDSSCLCPNVDPDIGKPGVFPQNMLVQRLNWTVTVDRLSVQITENGRWKGKHMPFAFERRKINIGIRWLELLLLLTVRNRHNYSFIWMSVQNRVLQYENFRCGRVYNNTKMYTAMFHFPSNNMCEGMKNIH